MRLLVDWREPLAMVPGAPSGTDPTGGHSIHSRAQLLGVRHEHLARVEALLVAHQLALYDTDGSLRIAAWKLAGRQSANKHRYGHVRTTQSTYDKWWQALLDAGLPSFVRYLVFGALAALERDPALTGDDGELLCDVISTAEQLRIPRSTWARWLVLLVKHGVLMRMGRGRYRLVFDAAVRRRPAFLLVTTPSVSSLVEAADDEAADPAGETADEPADDPAGDPDRTLVEAPRTLTGGTRSSFQGGDESVWALTGAESHRSDLRVRGPVEAKESLKEEAKAAQLRASSGFFLDHFKEPAGRRVRALLEILMSVRLDLAPRMTDSFPLRRALGDVIAAGDELNYPDWRVCRDVKEHWIYSADTVGGVVYAMKALAKDYQQLRDRKQAAAARRRLLDADQVPSASPKPTAEQLAAADAALAAKADANEAAVGAQQAQAARERAAQAQALAAREADPNSSFNMIRAAGAAARRQDERRTAVFAALRAAEQNQLARRLVPGESRGPAWKPLPERVARLVLAELDKRCGADAPAARLIACARTVLGGESAVA
jgi:hypothetical protein